MRVCSSYGTASGSHPSEVVNSGALIPMKIASATYWRHDVLHDVVRMTYIRKWVPRMRGAVGRLYVGTEWAVIPDKAIPDKAILDKAPLTLLVRNKDGSC